MRSHQITKKREEARLGLRPPRCRTGDAAAVNVTICVRVRQFLYEQERKTAHMRYLAVALVTAAAGVGANSLVEGPKPTIGDVGEWCGPDGYLPKRQMAGVIKPGAGGNRRTLCHKTKRWISPMGQGGICWSQKKPSRFSGLPLFRAKPSFRRPFKVRRRPGLAPRPRGERPRNRRRRCGCSSTTRWASPRPSSRRRRRSSCASRAPHTAARAPRPASRS